MDMLSDFISVFLRLWDEGGILMWPLLFIAIFIYRNVFELFSRLSQYNFSSIKDELSKSILDGVSDKKSMRDRLRIIKADYLPYVDSKINLLAVLTGVSPLLGLLGTVMGMLNTFAMMNSDGTKKTDLMAGGISEALITTQMGLIIAVPALFFIMMLKSRRDRLSNFFDKLECECSQSFMTTRGAGL